MNASIGNEKNIHLAMQLFQLSKIIPSNIKFFLYILLVEIHLNMESKYPLHQQHYIFVSNKITIVRILSSIDQIEKLMYLPESIEESKKHK